MFTPYHSITFVVLYVGGAVVVVQSCTGEVSLAKNPIQIKVNESKFDIKSF